MYASSHENNFKMYSCVSGYTHTLHPLHVARGRLVGLAGVIASKMPSHCWFFAILIEKVILVVAIVAMMGELIHDCDVLPGFLDQSTCRFNCLSPSFDL